ncbi:MAG: hypothetical protein AABZ74_14365 [Cyanobacteriota bacterium]
MKKAPIVCLLLATFFLHIISNQNSYAIDLNEELNNFQNEKQDTQNNLKNKLTKKNFFSILKKRYFLEKKLSAKQSTLLIENGPFLSFSEDGTLVNTGSLTQDLKDTEEYKVIKLDSWYVINMVLVNSYKLKLTKETNNEDFLKKVFEIFRTFSDSAVKYYLFNDLEISKKTRDDYKKTLLDNLEKINELKTKYNTPAYTDLRDPLYNFALDFNAFLEPIEADFNNELDKIDDRKDRRKLRTLKKSIF